MILEMTTRLGQGDGGWGFGFGSSPTTFLDISQIWITRHNQLVATSRWCLRYAETNFAATNRAIFHKDQQSQ